MNTKYINRQWNTWLPLPPPPAPQPNLGLGLLHNLLPLSGWMSWRLLNNFFFFHRVGLLAPCPILILEDHASAFISLRGRVATHFSRLLRHAWVTVGLFLFPGRHTGIVRILQKWIMKLFLCLSNRHAMKMCGVVLYFHAFLKPRHQMQVKDQRNTALNPRENTAVPTV
jgi:hypothetical protein